MVHVVESIEEATNLLSESRFDGKTRLTATESLTYIQKHYPATPLVVVVDEPVNNVYIGRVADSSSGTGFVKSLLGTSQPASITLEEPLKADIKDAGLSLSTISGETLTLEDPFTALHPGFEVNPTSELIIHDSVTGAISTHTITTIPPQLRQHSHVERYGFVIEHHIVATEALLAAVGGDTDALAEAIQNNGVELPTLSEQRAEAPETFEHLGYEFDPYGEQLNGFELKIYDEGTAIPETPVTATTLSDATAALPTELKPRSRVFREPMPVEYQLGILEEALSFVPHHFDEDYVAILDSVQRGETSNTPVEMIVGISDYADDSRVRIQDPHLVMRIGQAPVFVRLAEVAPDDLQELSENMDNASFNAEHFRVFLDIFDKKFSAVTGTYETDEHIAILNPETGAESIRSMVFFLFEDENGKTASWQDALNESSYELITPTSSTQVQSTYYSDFAHHFVEIEEGDEVWLSADALRLRDSPNAVSLEDNEFYAPMGDNEMSRFVPATVTDMVVTSDDWFVEYTLENHEGSFRLDEKDELGYLVLGMIVTETAIKYVP